MPYHGGTIIPPEPHADDLTGRIYRVSYNEKAANK